MSAKTVCIPARSISPWNAEGTQVIALDVNQYHAMIDTGILPEAAPIELIDGVLILKDRSKLGEPHMSVNPAHSSAVGKLEELRSRLANLGVILRTQQPITLSESSEPEPDGAIVRGPASKYSKSHPTAQDVCTVIEVAGTSIMSDRSTKLKAYARAGIPQYLIVNLADRGVELYEQPDPVRGTYRSSPLFVGDVVSIQCFGKSLTVNVLDLLPDES